MLSALLEHSLSFLWSTDKMLPREMAEATSLEIFKVRLERDPGNLI